jgi:hypothetical protein
MQPLPIYNLLGFLLICLALYARLKNKEYGPVRLFDKTDALALLTALIPVVIMTASYVSPNLAASLFQLTSEGWDNGSHILMLQDNTAQNGYVYGPLEDLKDVIIQESNAYPQAWHLATADIINGFGGDRFIPKDTTQTMLSYMIASLGWMVITSYLLVVCMWRFLEYITKKSAKKIVEVAPIIAFSSLVIVVVIISALMHGFTNYIGSLAYLILLVAMAIEARYSTSRTVYLLAIVFGTMSVLTWFLTLPAVALSIALMIISRYDSVRNSLLSTLRDWKILLFTLTAGVAMLFQLYLFQKFSTVTGTSQLNVGSLVEPFDVTGSPLHISHVLFGMIIAVFIAFVISRKIQLSTKHILFIVVSPWLLLVLGVYLYQNITVGTNSYYLTKTVGLCLTAAIIPIGALLSVFLSKVNVVYPKIVIPLTAIFVVICAVYASGQPTYGINKLFQANARTTYSTAVKTVEYLPKTTDGNAYIVVLTGRKSYEGTREDHHGKLELRVVHQPLNCTYDVTGYTSVKTAVKRLAECADEPSLKNKTLYVLTSAETHSKVQALNRSNIKIIET